MVKKAVAAIFMCAVMVLVAAVPLALADSHTVTKGAQGPRASALTWEYIPTNYGVWTGHITNNGLRSLVVDVYDNTTGMPAEIMHQRIRFAAYGAYPTGTVNTTGVTMALNHKYSITVTPNGPKGSTCIVDDAFKAAIPPVAVITLVSVNYLSVTVSGSLSSDADGSIVSYEWDFGDGSTATGAVASHTYATDGIYTITLLVTDNDGLNASATEPVTVSHERIPPVASFTAAMDWMVVSVDASASTDNWGPIASYDWNFGDGLTGTGVTASHVYAVEGTYTITLTVTDSDGQTGSAMKDVTAVMKPLPVPPVAVISVTMNFLDVAVDGSGSSDADGTIVFYAWTFGDGASAIGMTATHSYATDGTYAITLTVTDNDGLTGLATESVTVHHELIPPVASFTAAMDWMVVSVDASASTDNWGPIASYDWDFGDGSTGAGVTATHAYATEGTYTITLTVTDSDGQTSLAMKDVTAVMKPVPVPPVAMFTVVKNYLNVAVDGSGSSDTDGTIVSYGWTFGDGASATGVSASHSYAAAGTYTITLTVTDNDGLTGTASEPVTVVAPPIPPVAMFTVTQTYLDVAVDGSGSSDADGTIVSYAWTFGDGSSAIGMTATHSYSADGTYTITLTVTDNDGLTGSTSKSVTVGAAIPPVAMFSVVKNYLNVAVDSAGSNDPDGTIVSYAWTFGDGSNAAGPTATHSYASAGTYTITLTVTDNDGLTGSTSKSVTVVAAIPPVASFSVVKNYVNVAVDGSGSSDADGTIASYAWTFGDGASATGVTASHSYAAAGTYTITLTVTDNDGLTGSMSQSVTVVAAIPPVASFSVTQKYLDVAVDGSASSDADGTIVSYAWTFGDGSNAVGPTATHSYALAGTYTITLTVTDNDGLTGSMSRSVTVVAAIPPVASFSWTATYLNVAVDGSGSYDLDGTIVSYAWTFGDGASATGLTASHSYAADGTYTITLTVTDNDGLIGTASKQVTVGAAIPPVAMFSSTQTYLDVAVNSAGSYDPDGTIVSFAWAFGDGASATGPTATHSYALAGTYTITLTVTDNDGLIGTASKQVTVVAAIPPVAMFSVTQNYLNVAVDGTGSSDADGTIASYAWTFGDGLSATGVTASHSYAAAGTYTITLTVTDNDGLTGSMSQSVTVVAAIPPVASFSVVKNYLNVAVDGSASSDADGTIASYAWTFGDGSNAVGPTATHSYALAGTYTITLTVTDNDGLTGSMSRSVTVVAAIPPVARFTPTVSFLNVAVDGSASTDADGTIASYAWTFGDGASATGVTASHSYALAGTYTITLTVTDNDGLTGSVSKPVTVVAAIPPVAMFSWTQKYLDVAVDGSGSTDADGTIVSYAWTFGDGASATGVTATHSYALAGTYTITLTVTDNDGLTSTASGPVTVVAPIPPVAMFSVSKTYLSVAVDGSASSDADGTIVSYAWTFGDASSATGPTASHSYALAGTYTITLTVTDNDGLTGSSSQPVTVVAAIPPVAMFTPTVSFLNVAVDGSASSDADGTIVSYAWTFGDASSATGVTASHSYAAAGTYTVTLTVTDNDGLTGSTSQQVTVSLPPPPTASFTFSVSGLTVNVDASASSGTGLTYAWTWGDGTTGTGMTAAHTYTAAMAVGTKAPPGTPHPVFGFTTDSLGNPINGCTVIIKDKRTGQALTYIEDPESNIYSVDLSELSLGWVIGDVLNVTATQGTWIGWAEAPITDNPNGYDQIDVILNQSGPAPFDVTITLTVTDSFGRTAIVSQTLTLYP